MNLNLLSLVLLVAVIKSTIAFYCPEKDAPCNINLRTASGRLVANKISNFALKQISQQKINNAFIYSSTFLIANSEAKYQENEDGLLISTTARVRLCVRATKNTNAFCTTPICSFEVQEFLNGDRLLAYFQCA
jgi:hypothetical protein